MPKKIKKIMLIFPPVTRPKDFSSRVVRISIFFPLGLAYIAAFLEKTKKYEINILDALCQGNLAEGSGLNHGESLRYGLKDEDIAKRISEFSPDIIGVSCLFSAMQADALNICEIAKKVNPGILTVVGGAHAGAIAKKLLEDEQALDFVIQGEGEETFRDLLETVEGNGYFSKVNGLAFRDKGEIRFAAKNKYIENLDSLPFPARHLFEMDSYFNKSAAHSSFKQTPFTQMITSRGCPFKCSFCALGNHWGSKQRLRSAKNVLDEIEYLVQNHAIREIHFEDDNLTADKARAMEIFDGIISRRLNITWNVPSGMAVSSLDEELLEKMKASGCYSVSLAIESGNQAVLARLMNKPVDLKVVPKLVRKIRENGLEARGFFILGYPGETKETIKETVDFARSLELDWSFFFIASPIPNTKMFKTCVEKGYIKESDFDPVRSFYRSIIRTPEFGPEYLAEIREEAIVDVNFRNNPNLLKYDVERAIKDFNHVLEYYPHFDFAHFYLGEAYRRKRDLTKAIESYKTTLVINPGYLKARERLKELGPGR